MYRPLPNSVTIKDSGIHGLGLFATEDISKGTPLGLIYFTLHGEIVRTPLGGFGNHSDDPTCEKFWDGANYACSFNNAGWHIRTKRDVKAGEELTWSYTLYNVA